ncbi:MAG: hypothetical protein AB7P01_09040 [Bacteroidia bacterium]
MKRVFTLTIILTIGLLFGCNSSGDKADKQEAVTIVNADTTIKKYLTVVFLDISGSFNKVQKTGGFNDKNYFDLSCDELISKIRNNMIIGQECLIVKAIQNESFKDDALVYKLDLTDDKEYIFKEPKPKDDIKVNRWSQKKKAFEGDAIEKANAEQDKAVKAITAFKDHYSGKGTDWTDLVNAFNGVKPQLENVQYKEYIKRFIVYSDFRETKMKDLTKLIIDLDSVSVEGRFVSKNQFETLEAYDKNKAAWQQILKCRSLTFKTPEETIK